MKGSWAIPLMALAEAGCTGKQAGMSDRDPKIGAWAAGTSPKARDPVCEMVVGPDSARRERDEGKEFYFCSEECQREFQRQRSVYLSRRKGMDREAAMKELRAVH